MGGEGKFSKNDGPLITDLKVTRGRASRRRFRVERTGWKEVESWKNMGHQRPGRRSSTVGIRNPRKTGMQGEAVRFYPKSDGKILKNVFREVTG